MPKIIITRNVVIGGKMKLPEEVIEAGPELATDLIQRDRAVLFTPEIAKERAAAKKADEAAAKKAASSKDKKGDASDKSEDKTEE